MATEKEYYTKSNLSIPVKKSKYDANGKLIRNGVRFTVKKLVGGSAPYTAKSVLEVINFTRDDVTIEEVTTAMEKAHKKRQLLTKEEYLAETVSKGAAEIAKENSTLTAEVENLRKQLAEARNRK